MAAGESDDGDHSWAALHLAQARIKIVAILGPTSGVVADVLPDGIEFALVPYDTVIETTLPYRCPGCAAQIVQPPRDKRFVIPDDCAYRGGNKANRPPAGLRCCALVRHAGIFNRGKRVHAR